MKRISEVLTEVMAAAPNPCMTRASTRAWSDPESEQPTDATVKSISPPKKTLRYPTTSPSAERESSETMMASW